ncbi:MAG: hypothetical protein JRJ87_17805 [Deltaproteobacteria bacterium]|nr:hypothetical protein [Deltaproteobacteria bacterium]
MKRRSNLHYLSILIAGIILATSGTALSYDLSECLAVETIIEDPFPPFGDEAASKVAEIVCRKLEELAPLFGVSLEGRRILRLFIPEDMQSFTKRTGRGRYTLAVYSSRQGIITQPAQTLDKLHDRKKLEGTIAHELTHFLIHRVVGGHCPKWIHEGLAQWFQGRRTKGRILMTEEAIRKLELRWRTYNVPIRQRSKDYYASLVLVTRLIERAGQEAVLESLNEIHRQKNIMELPIGKRTLREWLYSADAPDEAKPEPDEDPGFVVVRGSDWSEQLSEEVFLNEKDGKVIDFNTPHDADGKFTPLPLKDMLKKARQKKKRKNRKRKNRKRKK